MTDLTDITDTTDTLHLPGMETRQSILDPGFSLTLRPMRYPGFYDMFRNAIANTWTVEEIDFSTDLADLRDRMTPEQHHLVKRLVAFFATATRSWATTWCSTSTGTSTPPKPACTSAASSTRRCSTSSST
jgi:hypothetical protein